MLCSCCVHLTPIIFGVRFQGITIATVLLNCPCPYLPSFQACKGVPVFIQQHALLPASSEGSLATHFYTGWKGPEFPKFKEFLDPSLESTPVLEKRHVNKSKPKWFPCYVQSALLIGLWHIPYQHPIKQRTLFTDIHSNYQKTWARTRSYSFNTQTLQLEQPAWHTDI